MKKLLSVLLFAAAGLSAFAESFITQENVQALVTDGTNQAYVTSGNALKVVDTGAVPVNPIGITNSTGSTLSVNVTNMVTISPTFAVTNLVVPLTNAATANYVWGAFTNTIFRANGGGGGLMSFTYKCPTNPSLTVFIFGKAPTAPTYNVAWPLTDADMQWCAGSFNLVSYSTAGTNYICTINNVNLPVVNKENTMLIYGIITTTSGTYSNYGPAASVAHQIRMSGWQD